MLAILVGICFTLAVIWWYIEYYRHFNGMWMIPTPKWMFPCFGHLLLVTSSEDAYWDLHKYTKAPGNYKYLRGAVGYYFTVIVVEPVLLEHLLTHTSALNKSRFYSFIHRWLGTGLLTSNREKWQGRRKLLTPAYHFKILEQFIDVFDKNTNNLVKHLRKEVDSEKTDVFPFVTLYTLDVICETAMGTSVNALDNADAEYVIAIKRLSELTIKRMVSLLKQFDWYYFFTEDYREEQRLIKVVHDYTISVIQSRRQELINKQSFSISDIIPNENMGYKEKIPFLDILLQGTLNGTPLSDEDIREEVDTFMFEGHDTTAAAISFCLYNLAKYPKIQAQVLEEQRFIYDTNPKRETTLKDLNEMKYLEMVIKETLRLYPSVPLFGRTISEDFTYDGITFKSGTEIGIMVYTLHRNPDIYPNPEVFDPERFTPEETSKRHPFAYLPFSAGSRNCVGQKFAMMEMKATIARVVRSFCLMEAKDSELKLKSALILTSSRGINIKLRDRVW